MTRSGSLSPRSSRPPHSKAVLFCPTCGYADRFDGDWEISETDDAVTYCCPACDELVQRRPVVDVDPASSAVTAGSTSRVDGVAPRGLERWTRAWSSLDGRVDTDGGTNARVASPTGGTLSSPEHICRAATAVVS
ncbi:hypothetical protein [Halogranum amylolyticum]|uniref:hypothetical protein n=1 Tax=Halogranum amylolyticum TaxID=660520 RepID=UPI000ABCDA44|nr:hypothetical protein [Halogranum amylolyticum]